jgi:hypothetical protein
VLETATSFPNPVSRGRWSGPSSNAACRMRSAGTTAQKSPRGTSSPGRSTASPRGVHPARQAGRECVCRELPHLAPRRSTKRPHAMISNT